MRRSASLVLLLVLAPTAALAHGGGVAGYSGAQGFTCVQCHAATTGTAPTVTFEGPRTVVAGSTSAYRFKIQGGPGVRAGLNVSANNAAVVFGEVAGSTQVKSLEITQLAPTPFVAGVAAFDFTVKAPPTAGTYKLFGAGNSCNGADGNANDREAFTNIEITVTPANLPPTVATAAAATPAAVAGTSTQLSVLGADDGGEAALKYTWSSAGPAAVTFAPNGSHEARASTATFTRAGSYTLTASIQDAAGLKVTSAVTVVVSPTLSAVRVLPDKPTVALGASQQFSASARDQFGQPMAGTFTYAWTVTGGGTLSATGLFTAGVTVGSFAVSATTGGKTGSTAITLAAGQPPTVALPASASALTSRTVALKVLGADDGGEAKLKYTWSATGPDAVTFTPNGANGAKNAVATLKRAGAYTFTATLTDVAGLTQTSAVALAVPAQGTSLSLTPAAATVAPGRTLQFTARALDQFGLALAPQPAFGWTASGGGTLSATGLFTAGPELGGPFEVKATAGALSATATLSVRNGAGPVLTVPPQATPATVRGLSTALRATAEDDAGPLALTYRWSTVEGPQDATFSENGSGAARATVATFRQAGQYTLAVVAQNPSGLSVTGEVDVLVAPTLSVVEVSPADAVLQPQGTGVFLAQGLDQFGLAFPEALDVEWYSGAAGSFELPGVLRARAEPGGPFTLNAVARGVRGTATFRVDATAPTVRFTAGTPLGQSDVVEFSAEAQDDIGLAEVAFLVDGEVVASAAQAPWLATWDLPAGLQGLHTVTARATDRAGNIATADAVQLKVQFGQAHPVGELADVSGCASAAGPASRWLWLLALLLTVSSLRRGPRDRW